MARGSMFSCMFGCLSMRSYKYFRTLLIILFTFSKFCIFPNRYTPSTFLCNIISAADITEDNLEDLLAYDDLFNDYFNKFLSKPVSKCILAFFSVYLFKAFKAFYTQLYTKAEHFSVIGNMCPYVSYVFYLFHRYLQLLYTTTG